LESIKNFNLNIIGDRILANLHHGRTEEANIKAIIPDNDSKKFRLISGTKRRR
jgi:hypothetical protein